MANRITETSLRPQDGFVAQTSRYLNSKIIYYGEKNLVTFTTYKKTVGPATAGDKFTVISPGMQYRPDLLSVQAYGIPDFWWKIMEANNISDVFDFTTGKTVRLPSNVF